MTPPPPISAFVPNRLARMLKKPDAWGIPEAVEFQILLLIEMCLVIDGAPTAIVDGLMGRYWDFLHLRKPGGPVPLSERLGLRFRASEEFIQILSEFTRLELSKYGKGHVRSDLHLPLLALDIPNSPEHEAH